ncbi:hypothetical protein OC861_006564 [Tilletia horrida]|nr:hypothetical protein OC845_004737 [Tilletia horrida]KAK0559676.1 hypothetical protein OC861_006564 [Tilletia horrida]
MLSPFRQGSATGALAFAFLIFSALTIVFSTPLSQVESVSALIARGSVYAGGNCTTNTDCYSKLCVNKVCKLQPTGGPCFENGNCVSKSCTIPKGKTNGTCSATGSLYPKAACTADSQCLSGSCSGLVDVHDQYGDETGTYLMILITMARTANTLASDNLAAETISTAAEACAPAASVPLSPMAASASLRINAPTSAAPRAPATPPRRHRSKLDSPARKTANVMVKAVPLTT